MEQLVEKKKLGRPKSSVNVTADLKVEQTKDYVEFVLISQNASYTISGYTDKEGNRIIYTEGKDKQGNPMPKKITFNSSSRQQKVFSSNKKKIAFLKNAPQCKGSPNAIPSKMPIFKINEPEKERNERLEKRALVMQANKIAIDLNSEELEKIAILAGMSPKGDINVTKESVYDYAEKQPQSFLDLAKDLNSRDTEYKVFLAKCLDRGIIRLADIGYTFDDLKIGADKTEAIRRISNDKDLHSALENKLNRLLSTIEA